PLLLSSSLPPLYWTTRSSPLSDSMPRPPHWALRCLSFLVVALLLAPIASSWNPKGMEPQCKDKYMACFVNLKCSSSSSPTEKILEYDVDEHNIVGLCDVHLDIKPYSQNKALIRLKTKSDSIKAVYKDKTEIFGCEEFKNDKGERNVQILPKDSEIQLLNSEVFWSPQKTASGFACEFYWKIDPLFKSNDVDIIHG
ncbi:hypothetical protein PMAYCL1PPCAC_28663, partial [Pristionchus mayeri]